MTANIKKVRFTVWILVFLTPFLVGFVSKGFSRYGQNAPIEQYTHIHGASNSKASAGIAG